MDPSRFTTPPGQRLNSLNLPSSAAAPSSTSSTAVDILTPSRPTCDSTPHSSTASTTAFSPLTRKLSSTQIEHKFPPRRSVYRRLRHSCTSTVVCWIIVLITILLSLQFYLRVTPDQNDTLTSSDWQHDTKFQHSRLSTASKKNPLRWLKENSYPNDLRAKRAKAAMISLVRNEELDGILQSMRQLEHHWNSRYNYPWIFFNEKPFSEEFKIATSNATSAPTEYHLVPRAHWVTPPHINQTLYYNSLDYLSLISVGKGHLLSYHAMIRWQSGLFYLHPALANFEYYWRVEPDVHFFCDIPYDPFRFIHANELVYGFNMAILDDARSFASLWSTTRDFVTQYPHLVHPDANIDWLIDPNTGMDYNNCQFFSNFEIGSLEFFRRNEGVRRYFDWLEKKGGFYYSRWGDAPVHTLMVSLFAAPERVWWFRDIGYQHDIARHCPPPRSPLKGIVVLGQADEKDISTSSKQNDKAAKKSERIDVDDMGWHSGRCTCEPTSLDANFYKLVPMESPQLKPADTCIRLWLGGEWLKKKDGWNQEAERMLGGDGYGGYVRDGV